MHVHFLLVCDASSGFLPINCPHDKTYNFRKWQCHSVIIISGSRAMGLLLKWQQVGGRSMHGRDMDRTREDKSSRNVLDQAAEDGDHRDGF